MPWLKQSTRWLASHRRRATTTAALRWAVAGLVVAIALAPLAAGRAAEDPPAKPPTADTLPKAAPQTAPQAAPQSAAPAKPAAGSGTATATPTTPEAPAKPAVPAPLPVKLTLPKPPPDAVPAPSAAIESILARGAPSSIADLKAMEDQIRRVTAKVIPCTVNVRVGSAQGSGVIVSPDGYVLTAAHVTAKPGKDITLVTFDGKSIKAKSLGLNHQIDSGLIKIVEGGPWPYVEMGQSADLKEGQWCLTTGHPGGYQRGREPVVRVGRVLSNRKTAVSTDCTLVGGDSGGPLFDMQGRVIGIHSRIGNSLTANIHVPVDTYRETWERLVSGEEWGDPMIRAPYLGVVGDPDTEAAKIGSVMPDSPAAKAGLLPGDMILSFDGKEVKTFLTLTELVANKKPGDVVKVKIARGEQMLELDVTVGRRN